VIDLLQRRAYPQPKLETIIHDKDKEMRNRYKECFTRGMALLDLLSEYNADKDKYKRNNNITPLSFTENINFKLTEETLFLTYHIKEGVLLETKHERDTRLSKKGSREESEQVVIDMSDF
jgi:hypothetical protein